MPERPAPHFPDDLAKSRRKLTFIAVDDHLQLKDATMTVDLDHVIANSYRADALFAYVPEHKMIIEGDIATAAEDLHWGRQLAGQHRIPEARGRAKCARPHDVDDEGRSYRDGQRRHSARKGSNTIAFDGRTFQSGKELLDVGIGDVQMRREAKRRPTLADEHALSAKGSDEVPSERRRHPRAEHVRASLRW
jgi:hypothetical protein